MDEFEEKWSDKYPHIGKRWRANWYGLMTYFDYPVEIRKLLYTTNIIERVNSKINPSCEVEKKYSKKNLLAKKQED